VTVKMVEGGDATLFLSDIKTEVDAIDDFPDKADEAIVRPILRTDAVVSVAVTGDVSVTDLKTYCDDLKDRMLRLPDIALVEVTGFAQRQIRIEVPATTLMRYGISADELARVVGRQSLDLPIGTIESAEREISLRFTDERRSPEEFKDLVVVGGASGGEIRLGDIARITDLFEPAEVKTLFNGRRAGILEIEKTKGQDVLRVYEAVRRFVENERRTAPRGITLELTRNVS